MSSSYQTNITPSNEGAPLDTAYFTYINSSDDTVTVSNFYDPGSIASSSVAAYQAWIADLQTLVTDAADGVNINSTQGSEDIAAAAAALQNLVNWALIHQDDSGNEITSPIDAYGQMLLPTYDGSTVTSGMTGDMGGALNALLSFIETVNTISTLPAGVPFEQEAGNDDTESPGLTTSTDYAIQSDEIPSEAPLNLLYENLTGSSSARSDFQTLLTAAQAAATSATTYSGTASGTALYSNIAEETDLWYVQYLASAQGALTQAQQQTIWNDFLTYEGASTDDGMASINDTTDTQQDFVTYLNTIAFLPSTIPDVIGNSEVSNLFATLYDIQNGSSTLPDALAPVSTVWSNFVAYEQALSPPQTASDAGVTFYKTADGVTSPVGTFTTPWLSEWQSYLANVAYTNSSNIATSIPSAYSTQLSSSTASIWNSSNPLYNSTTTWTNFVAYCVANNLSPTLSRFATYLAGAGLGDSSNFLTSGFTLPSPFQGVVNTINSDLGTTLSSTTLWTNFVAQMSGTPGYTTPSTNDTYVVGTYSGSGLTPPSVNYDAPWFSEWVAYVINKVSTAPTPLNTTVSRVSGEFTTAFDNFDGGLLNITSANNINTIWSSFLAAYQSTSASQTFSATNNIPWLQEWTTYLTTAATSSTAYLPTSFSTLPSGVQTQFQSVLSTFSSTASAATLWTSFLAQATTAVTPAPVTLYTGSSPSTTTTFAASPWLQEWTTYLDATFYGSVDLPSTPPTTGYYATTMANDGITSTPLQDALWTAFLNTLSATDDFTDGLVDPTGDPTDSTNSQAIFAELAQDVIPSTLTSTTNSSIAAAFVTPLGLDASQTNSLWTSYLTTQPAAASTLALYVPPPTSSAEAATDALIEDGSAALSNNLISPSSWITYAFTASAPGTPTVLPSTPPTAFLSLISSVFPSSGQQQAVWQLFLNVLADSPNYYAGAYGGVGYSFSPLVAGSDEPVDSAASREVFVQLLSDLLPPNVFSTPTVYNAFVRSTNVLSYISGLASPTQANQQAVWQAFLNTFSAPNGLVVANLPSTTAGAYSYLIDDIFSGEKSNGTIPATTSATAFQTFYQTQLLWPGAYPTAYGDLLGASTAPNGTPLALPSLVQQNVWNYFVENVAVGDEGTTFANGAFPIPNDGTNLSLLGSLLNTAIPSSLTAAEASTLSITVDGTQTTLGQFVTDTLADEGSPTAASNWGTLFGTGIFSLSVQGLLPFANYPGTINAIITALTTDYQQNVPQTGAYLTALQAAGFATTPAGGTFPGFTPLQPLQTTSDSAAVTGSIWTAFTAQEPIDDLLNGTAASDLATFLTTYVPPELLTTATTSPYVAAYNAALITNDGLTTAQGQQLWYYWLSTYEQTAGLTAGGDPTALLPNTTATLTSWTNFIQNLYPPAVVDGSPVPQPAPGTLVGNLLSAYNGLPTNYALQVDNNSVPIVVNGVPYSLLNTNAATFVQQYVANNLPTVSAYAGPLASLTSQYSLTYSQQLEIWSGFLSQQGYYSSTTPVSGAELGLLPPLYNATPPPYDDTQAYTDYIGSVLLPDDFYEINSGTSAFAGAGYNIVPAGVNLGSLWDAFWNTLPQPPFATNTVYQQWLTICEQQALTAAPYNELTYLSSTQQVTVLNSFLVSIGYASTIALANTIYSSTVTSQWANYALPASFGSLPGGSPFAATAAVYLGADNSTQLQSLWSTYLTQQATVNTVAAVTNTLTAQQAWLTFCQQQALNTPPYNQLSYLAPSVQSIIFNNFLVAQGYDQTPPVTTPLNNPTETTAWSAYLISTAVLPSTIPAGTPYSTTANAYLPVADQNQTAVWSSFLAQQTTVAGVTDSGATQAAWVTFCQQTLEAQTPNDPPYSDISELSQGTQTTLWQGFLALFPSLLSPTATSLASPAIEQDFRNYVASRGYVLNNFSDELLADPTFASVTVTLPIFGPLSSAEYNTLWQVFTAASPSNTIDNSTTQQAWTQFMQQYTLTDITPYNGLSYLPYTSSSAVQPSQLGLLTTFLTQQGYLSQPPTNAVSITAPSEVLAWEQFIASQGLVVNNLPAETVVDPAYQNIANTLLGPFFPASVADSQWTAFVSITTGTDIDDATTQQAWTVWCQNYLREHIPTQGPYATTFANASYAYMNPSTYGSGSPQALNALDQQLSTWQAFLAQEGLLTIPPSNATTLTSDWSSFATKILPQTLTAETNPIFLQTANALIGYLSSADQQAIWQKFVLSQLPPVDPATTEQDWSLFLLQQLPAQFLVGGAGTSSLTPQQLAIYNAYVLPMNSYFPSQQAGQTTSQQQAVWSQFLAQVLPQITGTTTLLSPSIVSQFVPFLITQSKPAVKQTATQTSLEEEQRDIMFAIFKLIVNMLTTLQSSALVLTSNLNYLGAYTDQLTTEETDVPLYTSVQNTSSKDLPPSVANSNPSDFTLGGYGGISLNDLSYYMASNLVGISGNNSTDLDSVNNTNTITLTLDQLTGTNYYPTLYVTGNTLSVTYTAASGSSPAKIVVSTTGGDTPYSQTTLIPSSDLTAAGISSLVTLFNTAIPPAFTAIGNPQGLPGFQIDPSIDAYGTPPVVTEDCANAGNSNTSYFTDPTTTGELDQYNAEVQQLGEYNATSQQIIANITAERDNVGNTLKSQQGTVSSLQTSIGNIQTLITNIIQTYSGILSTLFSGA